jgi:hypothetical protein
MADVRKLFGDAAPDRVGELVIQTAGRVALSRALIEKSQLLIDRSAVLVAQAAARASGQAEE